jgi:hypothetical protein
MKRRTESRRLQKNCMSRMCWKAVCKNPAIWRLNLLYPPFELEAGVCAYTHAGHGFTNVVGVLSTTFGTDIVRQGAVIIVSR